MDHMLTCFVQRKTKESISIELVLKTDFTRWLAKQSSVTKNWLHATRFCHDAGNVSLIPDATGKIHSVICCIADVKNLWCVGGLPFSLPEGIYHFIGEAAEHKNFAIAWGLG